jgi:hypothetical protein
LTQPKVPGTGLANDRPRCGQARTAERRTALASCASCRPPSCVQPSPG